MTRANKTIQWRTDKPSILGNMVKKKGKSKRISLKDKYKIQKRVVETHRKARKQA